MKKICLILVLMLAFITVPAFAGSVVSLNFVENPGNQGFAGGQTIGPIGTSSTFWNSSANATTGDKANGTLVNLTDDKGMPTGIDAAWQSANAWYNGDGTSDDQHKLAVGYLDDGGDGALVTLTNIPFDNYTIYGLYTSGQGDTSMVNFDVNGTWVLGGDASTIADVYGTINSCNTDTGQYWTQIVQGTTRGNYWVVNTTGSTCTINAEPRNGESRGSLTGVIIASGEPSPPQRSISGNFIKIPWTYHGQVSSSSNPGAGYYTTEDPNEGNGYLTILQAPSATWNEGKPARGDIWKAKNETGSTTFGPAYFTFNHDSNWHTSWYLNISTLFQGSLLEMYGTAWDLEDAKNNARLTEGYLSVNGGQPRMPISSVKKVPYGDYMVVVYMNPNRTGDPQEVAVEDQSLFYINEHGTLFKGIWRDWDDDGDPETPKVREWTPGRLHDPNTINWLVATDTEGPASQTANVAVFRHLSSPDMDLIFDTPNVANSGINAYQIIAENAADDISTVLSPASGDKTQGAIPTPVASIFEWTAPVNGADSYDVYLDEYNDADPNATLVSAAQAGTTFDPELDYGKTYCWRVDTNIGGETIIGDLWYFDSEGDPLLQIQPNSVSVQEGSDTFFTVGALLTDTYTWYRTPDAVTDTPEDDVELQSGSEPRLDITGVTPGDVAYYYVVLTNTIPDTLAVTSDVASLEIGKLELYLPFDGDPNDASGNGWDAVQGNRDADPALGTVSYDVGYDGVGQAVKFTRGSGDQLEVLGSDDYFNFYPKGFTIRFWVKPTDYGTVNGFMTYIGKGGNNWRVYDTAYYYGVGLEAKMYPLGAGTSIGRLDDGNWHMIAVTYDGAAQTMSVYQEGFLMETRTGALNVPASYPITIGSYYKRGTGGWGYDGFIDEVEIFSYPISQLEILEDYATKTGQTYCLEEILGDINGDCKVNMDDLAIVADGWLDSTNPTTATPAALASRVVSWQFDETSGMVAADSSGNGIAGTLGAGFTTGQWIADGGRTGAAGDNALYMDGSADTSVIATVADPNALPYAGNIFRGTDTWTINIWVKLFTAEMNNIGGFGRNEYLGLEGEPDSDRYFASWEGGLEFELGQAGLFPGNGMASDWSMLTATYDGTTCSVYFNGALVEYTPLALDDTTVNEINLNTARRVLWSGADATVPMNGHVDDFSIWDQAFTAEQVAGMYTNSFISCDGAMQADLNGDCDVTLADFAIMAGDWLECNLVPTSLCD
ncbi:MAG: laminin G domain-containing protein [Anaerohalosphaera sp.]|nr:laminin G domain-containing protein [Anaerohalosphaera sp.]